MTQLKLVQNLVQVVELLLLVEKGADGLFGALECSGKLVHVLGLDNRREIILQQLREVVLQLGASEVLDDILPVWRIVISSEVGLQLSTEDLERRTLSDTVRSDET